MGLRQGLRCACSSLHAHWPQSVYERLGPTARPPPPPAPPPQAMYNDGPRVQWGGHILGVKSQAKMKKREKALAKELAGRA